MTFVTAERIEWVYIASRMERQIEDYKSAAARHWDGVHLLSLSHRWQEAAYLAGYVAECSFKALLQAGALPGVRDLGHNLTILNAEALDLALVLTPAAARYSIQSRLTHWCPEQRYEGTAPGRESEFREMVQQADEIAQAILIGMVLDGLLEEVPL